MSEKEERTRKLILDVINSLETMETHMSKLLQDNSELKDVFTLVTNSVGELFDIYYEVKEQVTENTSLIEDLSDSDSVLTKKIDEMCQEYEKRLETIEFEPIHRLKRKVQNGNYLDSYDYGIIEDFKAKYENNKSVWFIIGRIYNKNFDRKKAYEAYDKATNLDDNYLCAWCEKTGTYREKDPSVIEEINKKLLSFKTRDNLLCHARVAQALSRTGGVEKGLKILDKMIEENPDSSIPYNTKGLIYNHNNDYPGAIDYFSKALEKEDLNIYYYNLAGAYRKNKEFEKSLDIYKQVLKKDKLDYPSNISMARILLNQLNDAKSALTHVNRAMESPKSNQHDMCVKANALFKLGRKKQSLDLYEKVMSICDRNKCPIIYSYYVDALYGEIDDDTIKEVIKNDKTEIIKDLYQFIINIRALINNDKLDIASELYDDFNYEHYNFKGGSDLNIFAWLSFMLRKTEQGVDAARKAISLEDENPYYLDTFACLLYQNGDESDAMMVFKSAVEKTDDNNSISLDIMKELFNKNGKEEEYEKTISKFK